MADTKYPEKFIYEFLSLNNDKSTQEALQIVDMKINTNRQMIDTLAVKTFEAINIVTNKIK